MAAFLEVGLSARWTEGTIEMMDLSILGVANMAEKLVFLALLLLDDGLSTLLLFDRFLNILQFLHSFLQLLFFCPINGSFKPYLSHSFSLLLVFLLLHFLNFSLAIEEDTH